MDGFRYLVATATLAVLAGCGGSTPSGNGNQETGNQVQGNAAVASNEAAAAENSAKADNAAAPATSGTLDRNYLVGRWSETGDCADATEFRTDGTFVFPWGDTGTWQLEGDQLTLSSNTDPMRLTRISQDQVDAVSPGGSTHHHRRC